MFGLVHDDGLWNKLYVSLSAIAFLFWSPSKVNYVYELKPAVVSVAFAPGKSQNNGRGKLQMLNIRAEL